MLERTVFTAAAEATSVAQESFLSSIFGLKEKFQLPL